MVLPMPTAQPLLKPPRGKTGWPFSCRLASLIFEEVVEILLRHNGLRIDADFLGDVFAHIETIKPIHAVFVRGRLILRQIFLPS